MALSFSSVLLLILAAAVVLPNTLAAASTFPLGLTSETSNKNKVGTIPTLVFAFGDSLLDVGTNKYLPPNGTSPTFPYGLDLPNSVPTARYSNGYNSLDLIAQYFGHQRSPASFLSLGTVDLWRITFNEGGINFASGGAGIIVPKCTFPSTSPSCINVDIQVDQFKTIRSNFSAKIGDWATDALLSSSIFVVSAGGNDIFNFYAIPQILQSCPVSQQLKEWVVASYVTAYRQNLKNLYKLGARKLVIFNIPKVGATPAARLLPKTCISDADELAVTLNLALDEMLKDLSATMDGMKYSIGNLYGMLSDLLANPDKYNLVDVTDACCQGQCDKTSSYCSTRNKYLFWDGVHPTQTTCSIFVKEFYGGSSPFIYPINLKQLAYDSISLARNDLPRKFLTWWA